MADDLELRTATDAEWPQLETLVSGAFLADPEDDVSELHKLVSEPDRALVVEDDGRFVASGLAETRDLSVPGGVVPTGHVTGVAVASTHRRRGLLTRIMGELLDDIHRRREPIAALWASEGKIYGRFGYGVAAWHVGYKIGTKNAQVPGVSSRGQLVQVTPTDAAARLARVYDRVRVERPGWSSRPGNWWKYLLADPKSRREGRTSLRAVLHQSDGETDGYALWRAKQGWDEVGPNGSVDVVEVAAATPGAYAGLWRFLLSIDLSRSVSYMFGAVDEPLPHIVNDPSVLVPTMGPSLWIRVVDVPGALSARRYQAPVDVVLEVTDDLLSHNSGRWHFVGDAVSAKCEATERDADIKLSVADLGAIYLGGTSLESLAAAGRVSEVRGDTLAAASTAFGWYRAPSAVEIF